MSDPVQHNDERDERDELDLDAETVRDLEPRDEEAEQIRGGSIIRCETVKPG